MEGKLRFNYSSDWYSWLSWEILCWCFNHSYAILSACSSCLRVQFASKTRISSLGCLVLIMVLSGLSTYTGSFWLLSVFLFPSMSGSAYPVFTKNSGQSNVPFQREGLCKYECSVPAHFHHNMPYLQDRSLSSFSVGSQGSFLSCHSKWL